MKLGPYSAESIIKGVKTAGEVATTVKGIVDVGRYLYQTAQAAGPAIAAVGAML